MTIGIVVLIGLAVLAGIYLVLRNEGVKKLPPRDRTDADKDADGG